MYKGILLFCSGLLFMVNVNGQQKATLYNVPFTPHSVTYNGSPNPNECWESVDWGILVPNGKTKHFFTLPNGRLDELKKQIGDERVDIEVIYFDEPVYGSGANGNVVKIVWKEEVLYEQ